MNVLKAIKVATVTATTVGKKWAAQNAPSILTGVNIGMATVAVTLAVPATLKAEKVIAEKQEESDILAISRGEQVHDLTNMEKIKSCWACYVPTALALGASITSAIFANHISATHIAALGAACGLMEKKYNAVEEAVGNLSKEQQKKVKEGVVNEYLQKHPVNDGTIEETGDGDTLFIDVETRRKFRSSGLAVTNAFKCISDNLVHDMTQSINDLYAELGLDESESGAMLGWTSNDWPLNPTITPQMTETGEQYFVVSYPFGMIYDFRDY